MCAQCGRPWHKHGHSVDDYDPDTGLIRGEDHYAGQAETTEALAENTRVLLEWARKLNTRYADSGVPTDLELAGITAGHARGIWQPWEMPSFVYPMRPPWWWTDPREEI
jgi:hypothetical protein